MRNIGIYIRVSTEEQARIQDGSLVSQKNRILEYIEYQNRPEFKRLLSDIQSGRQNLKWEFTLQLEPMVRF